MSPNSCRGSWQPHLVSWIRHASSWNLNNSDHLILKFLTIYCPWLCPPWCFIWNITNPVALRVESSFTEQIFIEVPPYARVLCFSDEPKSDSAFVSLLAWQRGRRSMKSSSKEVWKRDPPHCKGGWTVLWELAQPSMDAAIKGETRHCWAISIIWLKQNFSFHLLSCTATHRGH